MRVLNEPYVLITWTQFRSLLLKLPDEDIDMLLRNVAGSRGANLSKEFKIERLFTEYEI
jgi:hypothetical protein